MRALLVAEVRKLRTVRTTWVLTGLGLLLVALTVSTVVFSEFLVSSFDGAPEHLASAVDQIGGNAVIVLVVALLAMTTEFRHGTIGRTLQLVPSRTRVLAAKLAVGVVYALVFFALSALVVAALVAIGSVTRGYAVQFGPEVGRAVWQGLAGLALYALLGVAVGALIRSQVVAITLLLVWMFVVENLAVQLWPHIGRWLPFQAINAVFIPPEALAEVPEGVFMPLEPAVALTVFLGYVLVATVSAGVLLRYRDV